jgi:hypothetical protein
MSVRCLACGVDLDATNALTQGDGLLHRPELCKPEAKEPPLTSWRWGRWGREQRGESESDAHRLNDF